jgi:hypothetical protein
MSSSFPTNNPYIKTAMQVSDFTSQIFLHSGHKKGGGLNPCVWSKTPSFVLAFFSTGGRYCPAPTTGFGGIRKHDNHINWHIVVTASAVG